jgi:hypothetical protein
VKSWPILILWLEDVAASFFIFTLEYYRLFGRRLICLNLKLASCLVNNYYVNNA